MLFLVKGLFKKLTTSGNDYFYISGTTECLYLCDFCIDCLYISKLLTDILCADAFIRWYISGFNSNFLSVEFTNSPASFRKRWASFLSQCLTWERSMESFTLTGEVCRVGLSTPQPMLPSCMLALPASKFG